MSRMKNALRGHFIAPFTDRNTKPEEDEYVELAKWISDISDDTDETSDSTGFYDGDGTPELDVSNVAGSYSFEGFYDPTDEAQQMIADMKYKTGAGRKVWHKVVSSNGAKQWVGFATVSGIVAGSGAAIEDEAFSCTITYNQIPEETELTQTPSTLSTAGKKLNKEVIN